MKRPATAGHRVGIAVLLTLAVLARPASAQTGGSFDGRAGQTHVVIPQLTDASDVDGKLDEPVWKQAAVLRGFSQFAPTDGAPASDSTQVLVWYSPTAIHFGVRAFESHGAVHPNLADRDHITAEDRIEILLGTFHDRRQAYVFQVNPLGIQADGTLVETTRGGVTTGSGTDMTGRQTPDLSADFVFESKGRVTDYGYEVEIRIPFKSIRYQAADKQTWDIDVTRHVQHSGFDDSWTPATRSGSSFLAQAGTLEGLTDLSRGLVLDVNPEVTQSVNGLRHNDGTWGYGDGRSNLGGNVRYGLTNSVTLNATIRPDFSQIEADASQLAYDPRNAVFFPERRPFFLDGIEQFATPNNLVYTRQIVQPAFATKLTGTVRGTNVAFLSAADDPASSHYAAGHPLFDILRLQRDLGAAARIGAIVTDREDSRDYNRVAGLDARIIMSKIYTLQMQGVDSRTMRAGSEKDGPLWNVRFTRNGRTFGMDYSINAIDPDFETQSGFIARAGLATVNFTHSLSHLGAPGAFLENLTGAVSLNADWNYDRLLTRHEALNKRLHFDVNTSLRGGWKVGGGVYTETYGYDARLFSSYRIQGSSDTTLFRGRARIPNHDYVISFTSPQWSHFSANGFVLFGQDENFYEWQQAHVLFTNLTIDWRPTSQLRVNGTYGQQQYERPDDGSIVGLNRIPRLKLEYQVARPIFVRLVGEYNSQHIAPLRDDGRTNRPILFFDPSSSAYFPASSTRANRVSTQALFAYQPIPGTVFFAGYGSLLADQEAFKFQALQRQSDGFFLKLSYLLRAR